MDRRIWNLMICGQGIWPELDRSELIRNNFRCMLPPVFFDKGPYPNYLK